MDGLDENEERARAFFSLPGRGNFLFLSPLFIFQLAWLSHVAQKWPGPYCCRHLFPFRQSPFIFIQGRRRRRRVFPVRRIQSRMMKMRVPQDLL